MGVIDATVRTLDGRSVRVPEGGDSRGRPVLVHSGTPNSRHLYGPHLELALEQGIRLISYDRPGYGGGRPPPGPATPPPPPPPPTPARRPIADALDIDRFAIWGISGGGPHALACAALLPDRLVAVASLASPAPYDAPGLDYFAGMGELNAEDTRLMLDDPTAAKAKTISDREVMMTATAEGTREFLQTLLTPTDAAVMTGELAEHLTQSGKDGLAPGIEGWGGDGWAMLQPWGFDVSAIDVPVMLWHGRQDRFVPFQHGEWLAQQIPAVDAHLTEEDGHLTLIQRRIPVVHTRL